MEMLQRRIHGWLLISKTWPYIPHGSWPYFRTGLILDSKIADIKRMTFMPVGFIHLPEWIRN